MRLRLNSFRFKLQFSQQAAVTRLYKQDASRDSGTQTPTHAHTCGWCSGWISRQYQQRCWCFSINWQLCYCRQLVWRLHHESDCAASGGFWMFFLGRWGHRETHPEARAPSRKGQEMQDIQQWLWVTCWEEAIVLLEFPFSLDGRNVVMDMVFMLRNLTSQAMQRISPSNTMFSNKRLMTALIGLHNVL